MKFVNLIQLVAAQSRYLIYADTNTYWIKIYLSCFVQTQPDPAHKIYALHMYIESILIDKRLTYIKYVCYETINLKDKHCCIHIFNYVLQIYYIVQRIFNILEIGIYYVLYMFFGPLRYIY